MSNESLAEAAGTARYIMIGGFLGAGKTTAVARLARWLADQGLRIGLITNDQGNELVDTAMLRSQGFATEEIAGGCFCCRFNSLVEAANKLTGATRPDVFIAEPVGSCTDLVATVSYPLRRIYGEHFTIAPLSVLIDPVRAMRVLGLSEGGRFSEKVRYIYRKQLEEADLIVINKCDLLEPGELDRLREALEKGFPAAGLYNVSARTGEGTQAWFDLITSHEQTAREVMEVDYDIYADGEALLGWLNGTVQITSKTALDADELLKYFAGEIQSRLSESHGEVAHLKMTLSPDVGLGGVAVINLVRNDWVPELSLSLEEPVTGGQLIVNLRAEAEPESLSEILQEALIATERRYPDLKLTLEHREFFKPARPEPTHNARSSAGH